MERDGLSTISLFVAFLLQAIAPSECFTQSQLDNIANTLAVEYKVIDNLEFSEVKYRARITLRNSGQTTIPGRDWTIYFYSIYLVEPDFLQNSTSVTLPKHSVNISHIQGSLYSLFPVDGFQDIESGDDRHINYIVKWWSESRYHSMPNWFIAAEDLDARIIKTTFNTLDFVEPFTDYRQWKRFQSDVFNPFTPQDRFKRLRVDDLKSSRKLLIPTPEQVDIDDTAKVKVDRNTWNIMADKEFTAEAAYLSDDTGIRLVTGSASSNVIKLKKRRVLNDTDAHSVTINQDGNIIEIQGLSSVNIFHGIQTLRSLMTSYDLDLPKITIFDRPRFPWRGVHIDVARNFHNVSDLKRLMDAMATYKLNKLHLHLSDDEGWRLEIPGLQELTEIGGRRCFDLKETSCVTSQLGSGPYANNSGTGHYTTQQYKDMLQYAKTRHIEVIPELDMPGHAHAAVVAMEARCERIATNKNGSHCNYFRLVDPDDKSKYLSGQQYSENAINPCIESTYNFIDHVVREVKTLHEDIQPLKVFHFGGDEVASGAWENSFKCKKFLRQHQHYGFKKGLKKYFVERVSNITAKYGLNLGGWDDGYMYNATQPYSTDIYQNGDIFANTWENIWEWGAGMRPYRMANLGYKIILSPATHLYFDHSYEPDPEERGISWATRFSDTKKVFSFMPDSWYDNIDTKRSGEKLSKSDICGQNLELCDRLEKRENIIGIQAQLWSETVRTSNDMDYMLFPRILALAERAWHKASWEDLQEDERITLMQEDWKSFANSVGYYELHRLDKMGIRYRVPPPGARIASSRVETSVTFPGLDVQYSKDGGTSWTNVSRDLQWDENSMSMLLRSVSSDGTRYSRVVELFEDSVIDYISRNFDVQYNVLDNVNKINNSFKAEIVLTNNGQRTVKSTSWQIYLYSLFVIEKGSFPYPYGGAPLDCAMTMSHSIGRLFVLSPDRARFTGVPPQGRIACSVLIEHWNIAKTDMMPNWYVTGLNMEAKVIQSTAGESLDFVGKFNTPEKWKRYSNDRYDPFTLGARYEMNKVKDLLEAALLVVPTPLVLETQPGSVTLDIHTWVIVKNNYFDSEVSYLKETIHLRTVTDLPTRRYIKFVKVPSIDVNKSKYSDAESYGIEVIPRNESVEIYSVYPPGAFYAIQTLLVLMNGKATIPCVSIKDAPRYEYRGVMLDVARFFRGPDEVKKMLETMAMYKLNKLHFHLSDDDAWRLEIPGLPELTKLGATRCHDLKEEKCLMPTWGSGPDNDTVPSSSGNYSTAEYQDILDYAAARHIQVIPEIDSPGHSRAAIKSMQQHEKRRPAEHPSYLLSDPNKKQTTTVNWQMYDDNIVNPCLESTYAFYEKVIDELKKLHRNHQPLKVFHLGGDEVSFNVWKGSTACDKFVNETPEVVSKENLKPYFIERLAKLVFSKGLKVGAWEDGLFTSDVIYPNLTSRNVLAYPWYNVWEQGRGERAYQLANAGYKVVLSLGSHLYFDMPYEPDPEERGLYWATRYTDTQTVFNFIPGNIYKNAHLKVSGEELTQREICAGKTTCVQLLQPDNIVGVQGHLWTEQIRTDEQLEYMAFPRLVALAERAWHEAEWESSDSENTVARDREWEQFANTLGYRELLRLDRMDVKYRVPPPGAVVENGILYANTKFPGLTIERSVDKGQSWLTVGNGISVTEGQEVWLRTRSADGKRFSRILTMTVSDHVTSVAQRLYSCPCLLLLFILGCMYHSRLLHS